MKHRVLLLLLSSPLAAFGAEAPPELLKDVDPNKLLKLMDYNTVFLEEALYFSKRHRIVEVDTDLLREADGFTLTPFLDGPSWEFVSERLSTHQDMIHLTVKIANFDELKYGTFLPNPPKTFGLAAWDVYENNEAVLSGYSYRNRFHCWPNNDPDELDSGKQPVSQPRIVPPPTMIVEEFDPDPGKVPLKKREFWSVQTLLRTPDGKTILITKLKFTPKYSLVIEHDHAKSSFIQLDANPDGSINLSEEQELASQAYRKFRKSLPDECGKVVLGDIGP